MTEAVLRQVDAPSTKQITHRCEAAGFFIENNLNNPEELGRLLGALEQLSAYLQRVGIAHGDLQSGNLMVGHGGASVQLIDYDGMFIDEIGNLGSAELGRVNFQHPERNTLNPFDASLDRFSLISLWLSIRALQTDASLWIRRTPKPMPLFFAPMTSLTRQTPAHLH